MKASLLTLVTALGIGACAKQGQAPARTLPSDPGIFQLCNDARFESMCTPTQKSRPVQVDTNWTAPQPPTAG